MNEYCYCVVRPKGFDSVYSYIAGEDISDIRIGAYVLVPFGRQNQIVKGQVLEINMVTAEQAPFPVERTKYILEVISEEEYRADEEESRPANEKEKEDLKLLETLIEDEDYQSIFRWACDHHDCVDSPAIMMMVVYSYEICAEQNDPTAALNLGTLYYNGHGVPQDFKKAAELYEIAAAVGELRAICNLGYCYYYGRHQKVDYEKALYYFQTGALLHNDPNCLYKVGDMYDAGLGVEQNKNYAVQLYFRAIQACNDGENDDFCRADILLRLGKCFLKDEILEVNPERALNYLLAALSGFYARLKTDPFVGNLIEDCKEWIRKAEEMLEEI